MSRYAALGSRRDRRYWNADLYTENLFRELVPPNRATERSVELFQIHSFRPFITNSAQLQYFANGCCDGPQSPFTLPSSKRGCCIRLAKVNAACRCVFEAAAKPSRHFRARTTRTIDVLRLVNDDQGGRKGKDRTLLVVVLFGGNQRHYIRQRAALGCHGNEFRIPKQRSNDR